jgi:hypothetical protein
VDEATALLRRAETQVGVARAYKAKFDNVNAEAEGALVEMEGTIEEIRAFLAAEEEDAADDVEDE